MLKKIYKEPKIPSFWKVMHFNTLLYTSILEKKKKRQESFSKPKKNNFLEIINETIPAAQEEYKYICNKLMVFVNDISRNISSVDSKYHSYPSETPIKNYQLLSKMPLRDHLIRSFTQTIILYSNKKPPDFIAIVAAMALSHDIGKIEYIANQFPYDRTKGKLHHDEISALWVLNYFDEDIRMGVVSKESIVLIANTIKARHFHKEARLENPSHVKQVVTDYLLCLRDVDESARNIETKILKNEQLSGQTL